MAGMDESIQLRADDDDEFGVTADDTLESLKSKVTRKKGRGFGDAGAGIQGDFDSIDLTQEGPGPMRSIEGGIVFVINVHEEAQEDDIYDKFSEFGEIKNMHANLDRRTGFLKGYALVEYETYREANMAIQKLNGSDLLGQRITVDWAFIKPKPPGRGRRSGRR